MNVFKDFKRRWAYLMQMIRDYKAKAPERKEARHEKRKLNDERLLEELKVKTQIEKKKSEIAKERTYRERARLKLRKQKAKSGVNTDNLFGRPIFSTDKVEKKKKGKEFEPWAMKGEPSLRF